MLGRRRHPVYRSNHLLRHFDQPNELRHDRHRLSDQNHAMPETEHLLPGHRTNCLPDHYEYPVWTDL